MVAAQHAPQQLTLLPAPCVDSTTVKDHIKLLRNLQFWQVLVCAKWRVEVQPVGVTGGLAYTVSYNRHIIGRFTAVRGKSSSASKKRLLNARKAAARLLAEHGLEASRWKTIHTTPANYWTYMRGIQRLTFCDVLTFGAWRIEYLPVSRKRVDGICYAVLHRRQVVSKIFCYDGDHMGLPSENSAYAARGQLALFMASLGVGFERWRWKESVVRYGRK
jgi:hypothetical protein